MTGTASTPHTGASLQSARACHDALWQGMGAAQGSPWEGLDPDEITAYALGADAAIGSSGLREELAGARRERDAIAEQLAAEHSVALGWRDERDRLLSETCRLTAALSSIAFRTEGYDPALAESDIYDIHVIASSAAGDETADPFGVGAFTGHGPGCGCDDCEGARSDAAVGEPTPGPVYGGEA